MKFRLKKKDFETFLKGLIETYDLFAPVKLAEGVSVFKRVEDPREVNLDQLVPQKPAKEAFFPQTEVMFRFDRAEGHGQVRSTERLERDRVLLGARPCDMAALSIVEKVFDSPEYTDVYFAEKRRKTTLVGLGCNRPLSTCFCVSTGGGPFEKNGFDLFLTDLGEAYLVEPLTEKGTVLTRSPIFQEASPEEEERAGELAQQATKSVDGSLPVEGIEKRLDLMMESPFWDRVHEKCLGCGVCTFLCPTCHCFDISDEATNTRGERVRCWDSCLFPIYSLEPSGHNPRPTCRERTRQRLMHKLNYYPKNFGRVACVGCGRCIQFCPVQFDIREVLVYTSAKQRKESKERSG
ncbi:MAG: 4Fe-4S dicluster domain-containing protein [Desulfobacterota bacterium]|nr:4Fe-4S dicluster domain-containing protein [Thermodesulfobacteriota bacterium]